MVSYDCGINYSVDRETETVEELQERMNELDQEMLRWYVENDAGVPIPGELCAIHASVLDSMAELVTFLRASQNKRKE